MSTSRNLAASGLAFIRGRVFPGPERFEDPLRYYRECILQATLGSALVLGFFALLPPLALYIRNGNWQLVAVDLSAFAAAVWLLFSSLLNYRHRVLIALAVTYLLGTAIVLNLGFLSGGTAWLFIFPLLTTLFMGLGAAAAAIVLNGVTLFTAGWLVQGGHLGTAMPAFETTARACVAGFNFLMLNAIGAVSIFIMIRGLAEMGRNEKAVSARLELEKRQLIASQARLNREIDIRLAAEAGLKSARDHLDRRVKERTRELADKNRQLHREVTERKSAQISAEAANRAKSEFLANMSHELRTPLNHIIGFTELIADQKLGSLNDTQVEYLTDVLDSSHHLLSLIDDILDLSKVEAGKMEVRAVDVEPEKIFENGMNLIREKAGAHGIRLSTELTGLPPTIRVDGRKFRQILYNLLSNALKFTPDGGEIRLSASGARTDAGGNGAAPGGDDGRELLEVSVADTGIGIESSDLERIFNPFEQADGSSSRNFSGTGLGLSLSRRLVELHGGRLWAESEGPGRGSRFRFVVPAKGPEAAGDGNGALGP